MRFQQDSNILCNILENKKKEMVGINQTFCGIKGFQEYLQEHAGFP